MPHKFDIGLLALACLSAALFGVTTYVQQTDAACAGSPVEQLHLRHASAASNSDNPDADKLGTLGCTLVRSYELALLEMSCEEHLTQQVEEPVVTVEMVMEAN